VPVEGWKQWGDELETYLHNRPVHPAYTNAENGSSKSSRRSTLDQDQLQEGGIRQLLLH